MCVNFKQISCTRTAVEVFPRSATLNSGEHLVLLLRQSYTLLCIFQNNIFCGGIHLLRVSPYILMSCQVEGVVKEGLPSAMFRVEVGATGKVVLCTISGRIRKNLVRILVGDPVRVELSPYDLTRGRITFRYK